MQTTHTETPPANNPTPAPRAPLQGPRERPGNIWITIVRVFAWFSFFLIIASGIILGYDAAVTRYGSLANTWAVISLVVSVAGSVIAAFLTVAGIMVVLDLARDVSAIRLDMEGRRRR